MVFAWVHSWTGLLFGFLGSLFSWAGFPFGFRLWVGFIIELVFSLCLVSNRVGLNLGLIHCWAGFWFRFGFTIKKRLLGPLTIQKEHLSLLSIYKGPIGPPTMLNWFIGPLSAKLIFQLL